MRRAPEPAQDKDIAGKKHFSRYVFDIGTRVRDVGKSLWGQLGTVVDTIKGQDGTSRSFSVEMDEGGIIHHNTKFLHLLDLSFSECYLGMGHVPGVLSASGFCSQPAAVFAFVGNLLILGGCLLSPVYGLPI